MDAAKAHDKDQGLCLQVLVKNFLTQRTKRGKKKRGKKKVKTQEELPAGSGEFRGIATRDATNRSEKMVNRS